MALNSKLFHGDPKLEGALTKDPAHVTLGARGEHVGKIQMALFAIDWLVIDNSELRRQHYGPSTAKAVLAYKRKRKIINPAYQTAEDNIVGKMTMARLDLEMMLYEQSHRAVDECGTADRGGGAAPPAPALRREIVSNATRVSGNTPNSVGDKPGQKPQFGRILHITVAATQRAYNEGQFGRQRLRAHFQRARDQLAEYGMSLAVEFNSNDVADVINFVDRAIDDEHVGLLRKAAEDTRPGFDKILRVIICHRSVNHPNGQVYRNIQVGPKVFRPFVLLNSDAVSRDDATLLHEMIHASHQRSEDHDKKDPKSVFFDFSPGPDSPNREFLREERARQLSNAYFAF